MEEALRHSQRRVRELWVLHESRASGVGELVKLARGRGVRVRWVQRRQLDQVSGGRSHQGVALLAGPRGAEALEEYLAGLGEEDKRSLVLVALDQIQDPRNLGAIARSAACLGARGLIVTERRSSPVSPAAVQSSAGAVEKIPVYTAGNLAQTLRKLKQAGFWVYGADPGGKPAWSVRFNAPLVLVIGSEGPGLRRLVGDGCDELVAVPQSPGGVASLNASAAASVLLYEAARQLRGV